MPPGTRALIFDFDGVLADTEGLHFETLAAVLAGEGITLTREVNDREYIGIDVLQSFRKAFRDAGRPLHPEQLEDLIARKSALFIAGLETVRPFPGIQEVLRDATERYPCGIASGTLREEILAFLRLEGLESCLHAVVGAEEGLRSKPAPDAYLRALQILRQRKLPDLDPPACLVVEDSVPGIHSARAAGMRCLAVAHSHPASMLRDADIVLDSMQCWDWELVA